MWRLQWMKSRFQSSSDSQERTWAVSVEARNLSRGLSLTKNPPQTPSTFCWLGWTLWPTTSTWRYTWRVNWTTKEDSWGTSAADVPALVGLWWLCSGSRLERLIRRSPPWSKRLSWGCWENIQSSWVLTSNHTGLLLQHRQPKTDPQGSPPCLCPFNCTFWT